MKEFEKLPKYGLMRNQYGILPHETMLLFLSRLTPKKNPELLISAFAELNRSNVKLVFAGPYETSYVDKLCLLCERLGVEDNVIFVGPLFGADKISAMYDADIFILPSANENFGNVVAESVALGTPVIITNQCGIAPYIGDKVGLVISPNKLELIQGITNLLDDRGLYLRFKEACSNVAHDLSWDVPVKELEIIYKCVTQS